MPIVGQFGSLAGLGSLILPGGAMESIATITVGSGGAANVEFTSIPSNFQHVQIRGLLKDSGTSPERTIAMRVGNASVDTGSNYAEHMLYGNGSTASASAVTSASQINATNIVPYASQTSIFAALVIDILDYSSTSKYKTIRMLAGYDSNGAGTVGIFSGLWMSTSAVDTIRLGTRSGFAGTVAQYSTFALFGVRA